MSDTLRLVAEALQADATGLWARVLDDLATALPELAGDPRVRELLAATVQDTVLAALAVFSTGSPVAGVRARRPARSWPASSRSRTCRSR